MVTQEIPSATMEQCITLEDRRAFMRLSIEERRRLLERQAEAIAEQYESEIERSEREEWQGGDIVEF